MQAPLALKKYGTKHKSSITRVLYMKKTPPIIELYGTNLIQSVIHVTEKDTENVNIRH